MKTLEEASRDFHDACVRLFEVVVQVLRVEQVLDWLERQLARFRS